ncbi:MAG: hypothetical protein GXW85_02565 [Clostridia bacterium]|nr:hypothetical protein [Clostridia bacterium]
MSLVPVKIRILQLISENQGISNEDLLLLLKKEYTWDRNINEKSIEDYLISFKNIGMIELTDIVFDAGGKLKQFYKITDYGLNRLKLVAEKEYKQFKKIG